MKIIFMGTPDFAVPALEAINQKYGASLVVTVPDKPKGRGQLMQASPVKKKAVELGLPIAQPESLKAPDFIELINSIQPDIIVVIAFRILPHEVYSIAKIASFNVHGSLLPKFRGAAPINWAIINGEKETGLSSFILDKKVDTGNILLFDKVSIPEGMTAGDLHDLLMPRAANLALATIELLQKGEYQLLQQNDDLASPAPKLFRENCRIDWNQSSKTVACFINGLSPVPAAWTIFNNSTLKFLRASYDSENIGNAGDYFVSKDTFKISCGDGCVNILELQAEGKKAMQVVDFLRGYRGNSTGSLQLCPKKSF